MSHQTYQDKKVLRQEIEELNIPEPHREVLMESLELAEPQAFRLKFNFIKKLIATLSYTKDATLFNAAIEMMAKENNKALLKATQ